MNTSIVDRLWRAETLTAIGMLVVAGSLVVPSLALPLMAGLLAVAMLGGLLALALALLIGDQRRAKAGTPPAAITHAPKRVTGAFALVVVYVLAVGIVGFYPSTAISVPLIAYVFGYRNIPRLALATLIVTGTIYLIFGLVMSQDFPVGLLGS